MKPGPTGNFPIRKIDDTDEGELVVGVKEKDGQVYIAFGTLVAWVQLRAEDAKDFANTINDVADRVIKSRQ